MKAHGILAVIFLLATIAISSGCRGPDPAAMTSQEAQRWTSDSGSMRDVVAPRMAYMVFTSLPGLSNQYIKVMEEQIKQKIKWSFSTPRPEPSGNYSIRMTAALIVDLESSELKKSYAVSIEWAMLYNVFEKRPFSTYPDGSTLKIKEVPK